MGSTNQAMVGLFWDLPRQSLHWNVLHQTETGSLLSAVLGYAQVDQSSHHSSRAFVKDGRVPETKMPLPVTFKSLGESVPNSRRSHFFRKIFLRKTSFPSAHHQPHPKLKRLGPPTLPKLRGSGTTPRRTLGFEVQWKTIGKKW